jgi:hypothetical protein
MVKVPDDERILEILRRGGYDVTEDWAWISRYLELADKCINPGDKSPPRNLAGKVPHTNPGTSNDQQQPAEPASTTDAGNEEAAKATWKLLQGRRQSA